MMTRKDYVAVARIIADTETDESRDAARMDDRYGLKTEPEERTLGRARVIDAFVDLFKADNDRFDADRFRKACDQ